MQGVRPGRNKIEALVRMERPRSVKQIRQILGLASYFGRFVKNFATIVKPLTRLTKRNVSWMWEDAQERAFNNIKEKLMTQPVLMIFDPERRTEVYTDASVIGRYRSCTITGEGWKDGDGSLFQLANYQGSALLPLIRIRDDDSCTGPKIFQSIFIRNKIQDGNGLQRVTTDLHRTTCFLALVNGGWKYRSILSTSNIALDPKWRMWMRSVATRCSCQ